MSLAAPALRGLPGRAVLSPDAARDRSVRRRVGLAWALLFFNTLTYSGTSLLNLPSLIGKGVAQAALPLAIVVALTVNPKVKFRPNAFLCVMGLLVAETVLTAVAVHQPGATFRTVRLAEFIAALWLLTPWWGRSDMLLVRVNLRCLLAALGSVVVGLLISPGEAFSFDGRLSGVIWPMFPTQVAQYAAVTAGSLVVLWLGRQLSGRATLAGVAFAVVLLLLTHTRTALVALAAGILIAGISLFTVNARVRRFFAVGGAAVSVAVLTAASVMTTWLARGEDTQGLSSLTGRTTFWELVLTVPRTRFQEIFGFGLSNASINGLPIDSNWLSSYMQEGLLGVVICALVLVILLGKAARRPPGMVRALALFLVVYCMVASFTEDAYTDVSTYLLHLTAAASLLG